MTHGANSAESVGPTVTILAEESSTQILVVDSAFNTVASGTGRLVLELPPGIYKARFKAGNRADDHLFEVAAQPVEVRGRQLPFASPLPLPGTLNYRDQDYALARELAARPAGIGSVAGGELLVFVRDSLHQANLSEAHVPWKELSVRTLDQRRLVSLERDGVCNRTAAHAGVKISLEPGVYLICQEKHSAAELSLQLAVTVCEGWCTHVYLDAQLGTFGRLADLGGAAIMMTRVTGGGEWDVKHARLTELARQQFQHGHPPVSEQVVVEMLESTVEFPMLALYAAYSMLAAPTPNWGLITQLVDKLHLWLPSGHPDVDVLHSGVPRANDARAVEPSGWWPPMLAASWQRGSWANGPALPEPSQVKRFGQHRASGSMWCCFLFPREARQQTAAKPVVVAAYASGGAADDSGWHALYAGLQSANPFHSDFQRALRRRLVEAINEGDPFDPSVLMADLAEQLQVPVEIAEDEFRELRQQARTAALLGSFKDTTQQFFDPARRVWIEFPSQSSRHN